MEKEIVFLGTGEAMVTECFNTCFLLHIGQDMLLVDTGGGNGILAQLKKADIPITDIHNIFITHIHTDHILGILWLMRGIIDGKEKQNAAITVYGHKEVTETIKGMCQLLFPKEKRTEIERIFHFQTVSDNEVISFPQWEMRVFDTQSQKCKQFGIDITSSDHKRLVYSGDEPLPPNQYKETQNANVLIHEAFCLEKEEDLFNPHKMSHSTVKDVAEKAAELSVQTLILVHTIDNRLEYRKNEYCKEAGLHFKGTVLIPNDLERFIF